MRHNQAWQPELAQLSAELIDQMLLAGWTDLQEIVLWASNNLAPAPLEALQRKMLLARLVKTAETPMQ